MVSQYERGNIMVAVAEMMEGMSVARLAKELKQEARNMGRDEARFLVDAYYQVQEYRKAANNQVRAGAHGDVRALTIVGWLKGHMGAIETRIKQLLEQYAKSQEVGEWAMSICGIGPVITAGLLARIDIHKAPTVGHIWRYAGLDPTVKWKKGCKIPWNADLKTLCWKTGECFVKVCNNDKDFYGHLYVERKEYETAKNEAHDYADQAAAMLERVPNHKQKAIYADGILPPRHIHERAKRWTVKLFLAHFHAVMYETIIGEEAPKPYVIEHMGHVHNIVAPNWPMEE